MITALRDFVQPLVAGLLAFMLAGVVVSNLGTSWWARLLAIVCFVPAFLGIDRILSAVLDG